MTFLNHRLERKWETPEYYAKMIQEGHKNVPIPELPRLSDSNMIVLEVWNMLQVMPNMDFERAAEVLGIDMTPALRYSLFHLLVDMQKGIEEHFEKKMNEKPGQIRLD